MCPPSVHQLWANHSSVILIFIMRLSKTLRLIWRISPYVHFWRHVPFLNHEGSLSKPSWSRWLLTLGNTPPPGGVPTKSNIYCPFQRGTAEQRSWTGVEEERVLFDDSLPGTRRLWGEVGWGVGTHLSLFWFSFPPAHHCLGSLIGLP